MLTSPCYGMSPRPKPARELTRIAPLCEAVSAGSDRVADFAAATPVGANGARTASWYAVVFMSPS